MIAPFHLMLTVWGRRYCDDFLNIGAATLLAPGNLPARHRPTVLSVYTTREDWRYLTAQPQMNHLRQYLETRPFLFELKDRPKHTEMSYGHEVLIKHAEDEGAAAAPVFADSLFADGDLGRLLALTKPGRRFVMTVGLRIAYEGVMRALPFFRQPLVMITPREMARLAIAHRHSQMKCWNADSPGYGDDIMGGPIWDVCEDGFVTHSIYWEPALIDLSETDLHRKDGWHHHTEPLRDWTIDGHYPWANVGAASDFYAVQDSDQYLHVTLAREEEYHFEPKPMRGALPDEMRRARGYHATDPLRQVLFDRAFRVHGSDLARDAEAWAEVEERAAVAVRESEVPINREYRSPEYVAPKLYAGPPPCVVCSVDGLSVVLFDGRAWLVPQGTDPMTIDRLDVRLTCGATAHANIDRAWHAAMAWRVAGPTAMEAPPGPPAKPPAAVMQPRWPSRARVGANVTKQRR